MNTLKQVIDKADKFLTDYASVEPARDPNGNPLLNEIGFDRFKVIKDREGRVGDILETLLVLMDLNEEVMQDATLSDAAKADMYVAVKALRHGLPEVA